MKINTHSFYQYYSRFWGTLTGKEIEVIWRKENQLKCDTCNGNCEEERVDFEMLNKTLINIINQYSYSQKEIDNFQLFFKLLATKPTFAQITYRELSKLNK